MSDNKPPVDILKTLLKRMQEMGSQEIETTVSAGRFTAAMLKNAALMKLNPAGLFMVLSNLIALMLEHTDYTPGDILDGGLHVWHDEKTLEMLTKLMKAAELDLAPPCRLCGQYHPPEEEKKPVDPSTCN